MPYTEKFQQLKSRGSLPSPKGSALKLIDLCQQSNVALPEIIRAIEADPGLVGRVLKMANSPVYGRMRPVVSLTPDVLITIGIQSLRQVVLAFSLVSANRVGHCRNFDYQAFWSKSVATGVAAELIGAEARVAPPVELFTCGLLAQIGKLALAEIHQDRYGEVLMDAAGQPPERLLALEEERFGLNHAEISAAMMADWGIPRFFCDGVLHLERPEMSGFTETSRRARLAWSFHLAWQLASICFLEEDRRGEALARLHPIGERLELNADMLQGLGDQMIGEWKEWSALLDLGVHSAPSFSGMAADRRRREGDGEAAMTTEFKVPAARDEPAPVGILVAGGDPAARDLLKDMLAAAGHVVHAAGDGRRALQMVLEHQPQILVTDWRLPGVDGLQLIRTLRETELGRYLYIMVTNASDGGEQQVEALNAGADDYLAWPVAPALLLARLKAGLRVVNVQREAAHECEVLRRNALQLTIANQRAEAAALTDPLTGLYNRRYAMDRLAREWFAAERSGRPLSILLLDIDHFKAVNDTYGHNVGDVTLKRLAELLTEHSRRPDIACRIGGEEFCILAPETLLPGAVRQAERLRQAFETMPLGVDGSDFRLTISIGVAQKSAGLSSPEELLKNADEALYRAKHEGRNRVTAAPLA